MGLDATVMCRCLQDGLEIPSKFKSIFEIDDDGYPSLTVEYENNENLHYEFDKWLYECCPHEDMDYASEGISNWAGLRLFQEVLSNYNQSNEFETLMTEIPNTNGGITTHQNAKKMLKELEIFESFDNYGEKYILCNASTDEEIWEFIPQYQGVMILSQDINIGIDLTGFFIKSTNGKLLFSSKRFKQTLKNPEIIEMHGEAEVNFTDIDSGEAFLCNTAVSGKEIRWPDGRWQNDKGQCRFEYPTELYTTMRIRQNNEYDYIVKPLKIICKASVETKNPIRWC